MSSAKQRRVKRGADNESRAPPDVCNIEGHHAFRKRRNPGRVPEAGTVPDLLDRLYEWNTLMSGALHEDIGRVEVVLRNALDRALTAHGHNSGWPTSWYQRHALFPGKHCQRTQTDIHTARDRATRRNTVPEEQGKVIGELTLGSWRFLCTGPYLTSLWVPVLVAAFPNHPDAGDPRRVRADVDDRIQRVHFVRDRVAHHEPIHHRDCSEITTA